MKSHPEIKEVNASLRPVFDHWYLKQWYKFAELRIRHRQRELAQPGLNDGVYADRDVDHRR